MTPEEEFWALPEFPAYVVIVVTPDNAHRFPGFRIGDCVNVPTAPAPAAPSAFGDEAIIMAMDENGAVWGRGLGSRHRL